MTTSSTLILMYDLLIQPTVGVDFVMKCIKLGNKQIKLQIWDTAGQERFRALIPSYIRDCTIAIVVFDVTSSHD